MPGPRLCHSSWWGGWAQPGTITCQVWWGKNQDPLHLRTWGTKHMLRWGPRALDLDDCQTPTSPELGPLDSGPKMGIQNSPFLSGGWRGREQHSPSQRNLSSAIL